MHVLDELAWEGRTIACGRAGSGPDVVLCHGTPFSSVVWSDFADALSDAFTVHVWDMPGYGRSSKDPEHEVDFGVQARALAALVDHWGLERPHVVAHDFGGAVSLRAALVEGVAMASLMLVDVVAIPPVGSPFFRFVQEHGDVLGELPAYVHEAILRAYIAGASHHELRPEVLRALVQPWTGPVGQPAFYRQIAGFDEAYLVQLEGLLGGLEMPVKVVWGLEDEWIPVRDGRRLAGLIPAAELIEIPASGHLVQYDAPVALSNVLRGWLLEQAAPRR